jgi:NAD(P)-dependent dehydrogenase (short-subunit alcohol dehydrogenase family)
MTRLQGKVALITGASGGIGAAVARMMAAEGADVAVHYGAVAEKAEKVAEEVRNAGRRAATYRADVGSLGDVEAMAADVVRDFGRIDILVSNAGTSSYKPFLECTAEEWDHIVRTNLYGFFHCTRTVLPHMVRQRWGRIIATGSIAAEVAPMGEVLFTLSAGTKGGIMAMIKPLATEFARYGITVNCVSPGTTRSGMAEREAPGEVVDAIMSALKHIPLGRFATPEDIAHAMVFLASEEGSYLTGQTLSLNGGLFMR